MRLDRKINPYEQKYAIVNMREVRKLKRHYYCATAVEEALEVLRIHGVLSYGDENFDSQFFVIKHKDMFAERAFDGYATSIRIFIDAAEKKGATSDADSLREYLADIETLIEQTRRLPAHYLPT